MSKPSNLTPGQATELPSGREWVNSFASRLGVEPPTQSEFDDLLALAGVAAHSSERIAAPVACWLAARAGMSAADARTLADEMAQLT